jgi:5'-nucleotidase
MTRLLRSALLLQLFLVGAVALLGPGSPAAAAAQVHVRLIAFNDFHGHLEPGDNAISVPDPSNGARTVILRAGGAAFLSARIRALQGEVAHSVLISSGDLIGASPLVSALFHDEPTIEVMNAIGIDFIAVGNHEFDQGTDELKRIAAGGCAAAKAPALSCAGLHGDYRGARFPFLAANVVDGDGKNLFAPYLIRSIDGVPIGFIGVVTRTTPGIVRPSGVRGLHFRAEAATLNRYASELRAQGVRAIVAVVHEGGETDGDFNACENPRGAIFDIERALDPAIDVVLSAHTHRGYNCRVGDRIVIQGASFGRLVSVVDLVLDRASGTVIRSKSTARNEVVPNDRNTDAALRAAYPPPTPDAEISHIVDHYRRRAEPLALQPAGRIAAAFTRRAEPGGDHAAGRLIADAQLAATTAAGAGGAQIAFTNTGGVRTDLIAQDADGRVTYGDAFAMQPFGNSLVTLTLTGTQLKRLLESQWSRRAPDRVRFLQPSRGFRYGWYANRPWGEHVDDESMHLHGRRIEPQHRYRVTVNSFLAAGGDGFAVLRDGTDPLGGPQDVDALVDFLRAESAAGPLAPAPEPRIQRLD